MKKIYRLSWWQKIGLIGGLLFALHVSYVIGSGLRRMAWNYMIHWERESFYDQLMNIQVPNYVHMSVACLGKYEDAWPTNESEYNAIVAKEKECEKFIDQASSDSQATQDALSKVQSQVAALRDKYDPKEAGN